MLGIPVGLVTANAAEWVFHKYVQHGFGRRRDSFWGFHWNEHHRVVRQQDFADPGYRRFPLGRHAQGREVTALLGAGLAIAPLFPVTPFFVGTLWWSGWRYYSQHKKAHLDPEWGKANLPWHYDHHMGPNPNANWCVTKPWFDHLMGTREPFLKTPPKVGDAAQAN